MNAAKLAITVDEAAKRSGIGRDELYRQCHDNCHFPCFKVGRKILIYVDGFDKWIARLAQNRAGFRR